MEILEHIFWECKISKTLIDEILPGQLLPFMNKMFFVCFDIYRVIAKNNISLLIKLYLYKCKLNNVVPNITGGKRVRI